MNVQFKKARLGSRALIAAVVVAALSWSPVLASAGTAHKKKHLSQSSVTVANGPNVSSGPLFIALYSGLYKKYGLDVTWLNTNTGTAASITVLLAGSVQFTSDGAAAQIQAVQNGAPIRALAAVSIGGSQTIEITNAFAAAHGIPSKNQTDADALKQFLALKGSHITVAVSTLTSNAYQQLHAAAFVHGLTVGQGSTNDINIVTAGTVPNLVSGFLAGKYDAIANVPPYVDQPGGIQVPYGKVTPLKGIATNYLVTTIGMVQQHPDTVQAFVNAIFDAAMYPVKHKKAAEHDIAYMYGQNGTTDPAQQQLLYDTGSVFWAGVNPYPTKKVFNATVTVSNYSLLTPFTVPYTTYVIAEFARNAAKRLGLSTKG